MQDNTVSNTTLFDGTTDKTEELNDAVLKSFSEGDVVPVTMDGIVVGTATVLAGGGLSVTLNDEEISARLDVGAGGYSMAFTDDPNG